MVLAAPFTALAAMHDSMRATPYILAAQDVFWEDSGAYTGEVSASLLVDVGCAYVIIGHSERRQYFGETDETVSKVAAALRSGLHSIVCGRITSPAASRGNLCCGGAPDTAGAGYL